MLMPPLPGIRLAAAHAPLTRSVTDTPASVDHAAHSAPLALSAITGALSPTRLSVTIVSPLPV